MSPFFPPPPSYPWGQANEISLKPLLLKQQRGLGRITVICVWPPRLNSEEYSGSDKEVSGGLWSVLQRIRATKRWTYTGWRTAIHWETCKTIIRRHWRHKRQRKNYAQRKSGIYGYTQSITSNAGVQTFESTHSIKFSWLILPTLALWH